MTINIPKQETTGWQSLAVAGSPQQKKHKKTTTKNNKKKINK